MRALYLYRVSVAAFEPTTQSFRIKPRTLHAHPEQAAASAIEISLTLEVDDHVNLYAKLITGERYVPVGHAKHGEITYYEGAKDYDFNF